MKTVFSNTQCAHVWAQQTQDSGRSSGMSFQGTTLYSYRTPIAKFYSVDPSVPGRAAGHAMLDRKVVLATSETYSTTTSSKHMPAMRRAIRDGVRVFSVPHVDVDSPGDRTASNYQGMAQRGTHLMNLDALVARYVAERQRQMLKIKVYGTAYNALEEIQRDARAYALCFGLSEPTLNAQADADGIEAYRAARKAKRETPEYLAKQAKEAERAALRAAQRDAIRAAEQLTARNDWQAGRAHWFSGVDDRGGVFLRLSNSGDRVETSRGAHIPTADARAAIKLIRVVVESGYQWTAAGHAPLNVGAFTVDRVEPNGDIKAGCHFIQFGEIDRIGKLLGV